MPNIKYDQALAQAIVDTIREPLLVLDEELRVVAASRSFYNTFKVTPEKTDGRLLSELGDSQWDISALIHALKHVSPDESVLENYELELDFPTIGKRIMCLNARKVFYQHGAHSTILLAFEDMTERRAAERERDLLMRDKDLLLQEIQHRVANSLQIIASILLMKARAVNSDETRSHLQDAHRRVLAVAAVQKYLRPVAGDDAIDMGPYLTQLCASLAGSMISENHKISIETEIDESEIKASDAVSVGLIVTELVINALKHAFPVAAPTDSIMVTYRVSGATWRLTVADNGIGKNQTNPSAVKTGLGMSIVAALADQLQALVESVSGSPGFAVSLTHAALRVAAAPAFGRQSAPLARSAGPKVGISLSQRRNHSEPAGAHGVVE